MKGQALDLCQELFVADGARSDEEDAVLQNLRELLAGAVLVRVRGGGDKRKT